MISYTPSNHRSLTYWNIAVDLISKIIGIKRKSCYFCISKSFDMSRNAIINVNGVKVSITTIDKNDYICLTDMVRSEENGLSLIEKWVRNKNTIEFLGIWEQLNNPNFNSTEFEGIKNMAGLNRFILSVKQWIEKTGAIGIKAKAGRYGGTYAHKDIAFEFGSWLSPTFKLYLIKEYQRLKEIENNPLSKQWDVKRILSKTNYMLHTDSIKANIIPKMSISKTKERIVYANEADMLNLALFGYTAKDWEEANPELSKKLNMRDTASINQLVVLSNMESYNSEMIKNGIPRDVRFTVLHRMAKEQLGLLNSNNAEQKFRKIEPNTNNIE